MALRLRASALVGLSWNSDATRQIWSEASDGTASVSSPLSGSISQELPSHSGANSLLFGHAVQSVRAFLDPAPE